jgi:hypothetical protein
MLYELFVAEEDDYDQTQIFSAVSLYFLLSVTILNVYIVHTSEASAPLL